MTSPPYDNMRTYEGYSALEFKKIAHALYNILKKGGVLVWIVGDETIHGNETGTSFEQALYFRNHVGFQLFDTMIYLKPPRGAVGNNKTYWQSFEYMFVLSKGTPKTIHLLYDRENKEVRTGDHGSKRYADGRIRGWLCRKCNTALGTFDDNPTLLQQAIDWIPGKLFSTFLSLSMYMNSPLIYESEVVYLPKSLVQCC